MDSSAVPNGKSRCLTTQKMYNFINGMLLNQTLGERFYVVKRTSKGFVLAALVQNQKNFTDDQTQLDYEWELFLRYYDSKGKERPNGTKEYTKMRSTFLNGIIKCKSPGNFSFIKEPSDIAKFGLHPIKGYRYILYQCDDVQFLPNWPVGTSFATLDNDFVKVSSTKESPIFEFSPKFETKTPNVLFTVKVNAQGIAETMQLLAYLTDEQVNKVEQYAQESNILEQAVAEVIGNKNPCTQEFIELLSGEMEVDSDGNLSERNFSVPETELPSAQGRSDFIGLESQASRFSFESIACAMQETVNASQDPPMECNTPIIVEKQEPSLALKPDTVLSLESSEVPNTGSFQSRNLCPSLVQSHVEPMMKDLFGWSLDENHTGSGCIEDEFDPDIFLNKSEIDTQDVGAYGIDNTFQFDTEFAEDFNFQSFWDIEDCSMHIPRGVE